MEALHPPCERFIFETQHILRGRRFLFTYSSNMNNNRLHSFT